MEDHIQMVLVGHPYVLMETLFLSGLSDAVMALSLEYYDLQLFQSVTYRERFLVQCQITPAHVTYV